jgi:Ca2+/Na+ antiporter
MHNHHFIPKLLLLLTLLILAFNCGDPINPEDKTYTTNLSGTVRDLHDTVLQGVLVEANGTSSYTDANGVYQFADLKHDGKIIITASKADYIKKTDTVTTTAGTCIHDMQLAGVPSYTIVHGKMTNQFTGDPVPGTYISVRGLDTSIEVVQTDLNGNYTAPAIAHYGEISISVNPSTNYLGKTLCHTFEAEIPDEFTWDFSLQPNKATITGKVTQAIDGAAIADVLVTIGGSSTYTDADGNYTFNLLQYPVPMTVTAAKSGYLADPAQPVTVNADPFEHNILLQTESAPYRTLETAKIIHGSGAPLAGVTVTVTGNSVPEDVQTMTTAADGIYALSVEHTGGVKVSASYPGYGSYGEAGFYLTKACVFTHEDINFH